MEELGAFLGYLKRAKVQEPEEANGDANRPTCWKGDNFGSCSFALLRYPKNAPSNDRIRRSKRTIHILIVGLIYAKKKFYDIKVGIKPPSSRLILWEPVI